MADGQILEGERPVVLLLGDDASYLDMLDYVLEAEGFATLELADDNDLDNADLALKADLILLDGGSPQSKPSERLAELRRNPSTRETPAILLTDQYEPRPATPGNGLDHFVARSSGHKAIIANVLLALQNDSGGTRKKTLSYGGVEMNLATHRVHRGGREIHLTPTEFRLLKHFLEHPDRVFSREQLADAVWQVTPYTGGRKVDVHVARLRKALGAEPHNDLIRTVWTVGYAFSAE